MGGGAPPPLPPEPPPLPVEPLPLPVEPLPLPVELMPDAMSTKSGTVRKLLEDFLFLRDFFFFFDDFADERLRFPPLRDERFVCFSDDDEEEVEEWSSWLLLSEGEEYLRTEKLSQITCAILHKKKNQQLTVFLVAAVHFCCCCRWFGRNTSDVGGFLAWFACSCHKNCVKSDSNLSKTVCQN